MSKSAAINMRVEPSQHALLTKAAALLNKDRTAFILDVACREAENVLLDQRLFHLNERDFEAFEKALNAPLANNKKLKALMIEPSLWEKEPSALTNKPSALINKPSALINEPSPDFNESSE